MTKNELKRGRGSNRLAAAQENAIGGAKHGPSYLAAKDRKLMAENDDLELLEFFGATAQPN